MSHGILRLHWGESKFCKSDLNLIKTIKKIIKKTTPIIWLHYSLNLNILDIANALINVFIGWLYNIYYGI